MSSVTPLTKAISEELELTILMPCLDEAETLEICITKAKSYLGQAGVEGEVLIADNGSTDGSQEIAKRLGARVVPVSQKGYGAALLGGIAAARGRYIIMGDADDSYEFSDLSAFVERLRDGADLVMGNRFKGGIKPGAMPPLHRYLGNPVLTAIGRQFYGSPIGDFHCGGPLPTEIDPRDNLLVEVVTNDTMQEMVQHIASELMRFDNHTVA